MHNVGQRLIGLRAVYGLSQRELAKRAGVPNSAISVIEQGKSSPSTDSLGRVLSGFPLTLQQFFQLSPPESSPLSSFEQIFAERLQIHRHDMNDSDNVAITCGPTKLVVISGSLKLTTCFFAATLACGDDYFLTGNSPYRIDITGPETVWIEVCMPE